MNLPPKKCKNKTFLALIWIGLLFCVFLVLQFQARQTPLAHSQVHFDKELFLRKSSQLHPDVERTAIAYVSVVEQMETMPFSGPSRPQAASNFNQSKMRFAFDWDVWGQKDYWASPLEFFLKGRGDCEDFAFSAYELLRISGTPQQKLRMAYVHINLDGQRTAHMVVLVADAGDHWVIDNTRAQATRLSTRDDLEVEFSFDNAYVYEGTSQHPAGNSQERISRWQDLLAKARSEGFF